jgi:hypothetical protein
MMHSSTEYLKVKAATHTCFGVHMSGVELPCSTLY